MELRHLHSFAAAAELRSFTQAAKSLSLTQAAVSQHVAALEKELKVSLFDRSARRVEPTEAGRCFYDYCRRILDLVDEARSALGQVHQRIVGTLQIAASTVPAETLLTDLLLEFRRRYPEIRESVMVTDSSLATQAVESGEAEVGFVGEMPRSSRLSSKPIGTDELVLVVSPEDTVAGKRRLTWNQLKGLPLIVREAGSGSRRCVEGALEAAGFEPGELNVVMEMNSNEAIRSAVERGIGAAFLSRMVIRGPLDEGRLVALSVQGVRPHRHLYLLSDTNRIPSGPLRALLGFIDKWLESKQDS